MDDVGDGLGVCNSLEELFGNLRLAAECTRLGCQLLLGLRGEGRVDDQTVHEQEDVVLDLGLLQLHTALVLLHDNLLQLVDNLIGDEVDVRTTVSGGNRVDERHLLECAIRDSESNFPALMRIVGQNDLLWCHAIVCDVLGLDGLGVHLHVLLELVDFDPLAVQEDLDSSAGSSHVVYSALDQCLEVVVHFFHAEFAEVRLESDFCVVVTLDFVNFRLSHLAHVFAPCLSVTLLRLRVNSLEGEFRTVDVGELGSVTVTATSDFGLVIVVVRRCEQVTKDHLWNPNALLLVHFHRNTTTVVLHGNHAVLTAHLDAELVHVLVALLVVRSVHQNFVKDLV